MKKYLIVSSLFLSSISSFAQSTIDHEQYGNTLNLGAGIGYYGFLNNTLPVLSFYDEIDVCKNFTLGPFIEIYTYKSSRYWGNPDQAVIDPSYRNYNYKATIVPVGLRGTYYFDELFQVSEEWDFYAAGSLGIILKNVVWENAYNGDKTSYKSPNSLYLSAHIGAEYHMNKKTGLILDLSTGVSTFGVAFHL